MRLSPTTSTLFPYTTLFRSNLTVLCAKKRIGLAGAPTSNNNTINATIMAITTVELNCHHSFFLSLFITYERRHRKRTCPHLILWESDRTNFPDSCFRSEERRVGSGRNER